MYHIVTLTVRTTIAQNANTPIQIHAICSVSKEKEQNYNLSFNLQNFKFSCVKVSQGIQIERQKERERGWKKRTWYIGFTLSLWLCHFFSLLIHHFLVQYLCYLFASCTLYFLPIFSTIWVDWIIDNAIKRKKMITWYWCIYVIPTP